MNKLFLQLAFVCAASLLCFSMCSKENRAQPSTTPSIDRTKFVGTWSITKALFNYYGANEKLLRKEGIEKDGLHADAWDHSTLIVKDSSFSSTGNMTQDHLPHAGKWLLASDGKMLSTSQDSGGWAVDWDIVSYNGSILTIRHRETRDNGSDEKIAEALLELTKE